MAGGPITTGNIPAAHWPGVHAFIQAEYDEHPTEYTVLYTTESSKMGFEKDVAFTSFGLAKVMTQGGGVDYDSETQDYSVTYNHLTIGLGFIVTRNEYDDNLYDAVGKRRSKRLARSMRQTTEVFAAAQFNLGFGTSNPYFTMGDGVAFFSASHPTKAGNQSNNPVNVDISETALEALQVAVMTATDGKGLTAKLIADSLHIHPNNWFEANRILKSVLQNDSANNAINVLKMVNAFPKGIHMNHYFTSTTAYFVRTNCPNGATHFLRREMESTRDNDFDTENLKVKATKRESFGVSDWRSYYASAPA
jgi:hypothetical protein